MATTATSLLTEIESLIGKLPKKTALGQLSPEEAADKLVKELQQRHRGDEIKRWREHQIKWNGEYFNIVWNGSQFRVQLI